MISNIIDLHIECKAGTEKDMTNSAWGLCSLASLGNKTLRNSDMFRRRRIKARELCNFYFSQLLYSPKERRIVSSVNFKLFIITKVLSLESAYSSFYLDNSLKPTFIYQHQIDSSNKLLTKKFFHAVKQYAIYIPKVVKKRILNICEGYFGLSYMPSDANSFTI